MCADLTQELPVREAEAAAVIGKAGKKEAVTQLAASEADADATVATKLATESEAHFQSECSWLREFQQRDDRTPGYCLVDDLKRARQVKLLKKSRAKATSASESAAAIKAATESKGTTGVRQLERETAATNNKELATAESHIEELQETNTQMLKATEPISWQQQLDRINSSKPHERAAAMQELPSFQQDALNCICYCTGLEIDLFSTSPTATARYTVNAAVRATHPNQRERMAGTYRYRLSQEDNHRT